jgi:hypothetical protein
MKRSLLSGSLFVVLLIAGCSDQQPASPDPGTPSLGKRAPQEQGDPAILAKMHEINAQLASRGSNLFLNEITAFTWGRGRPTNRILQQPFRWVPNDPRRDPSGDNITYLVDLSDGATTSGLTAAQTDAAIDAAMNTWNTTVNCSKVNIVENPDPASDPDIFDSFFGFGGYGYPYYASITEAGWLPGPFFDAVYGPGAQNFVLAFSISFIYLDGAGAPTDINNDQYFDTALNEVYYNDNWGSPGPRLGYPWGINAPLPGIDVQTIGLHENGHSLSSGHWGPPPIAVMNPVYAGIRQALYPTDEAAHCTFFARWPNP